MLILRLSINITVYNMEEQRLNDQLCVEPKNDMGNTKLGAAIVSAFAYFFSMLAFILFVCPFAFWKGAVYRLQKECKNKSLKTFVHTSRWPFLSFLRKIFFEFFIDGMIFISYFVGIIFAFVAMTEEFSMFLLVLVATYYSPLCLSWVRDLLVLMLLPFQKFLSWVSKPAQQIDVDFHNK